MPEQNQQQQGPLAALTLERFAGCNTATTRQGVPDEQAFWIDGFLPLAERNLRTLWGIGSSLYTAVGKSVVCFYFYNIGPTPYAIVFLSDGSAVQVRTTDGATTTILSAATIQNPNITQLAVSQYGKQYLLIVANQTNGYWVWDGSLLYTAGSLAPLVTLTNVGAGYVSPPFVTVTGGSGFGAAFTATIGNGVVTNVAITNPGQGYLPGDTVTLVFSGGTQSGTGASLTAVLSHQAGGSGASLTCVMGAGGGPPGTFQVNSVTINNGGSGYSPETAINVSGGSPTIAAVLSPVITGGVITSVNILNHGSYSNASAPAATVVDNGFFYVSSVTIGSGGSGYGPNRAITASSGGSPLSQATFSSNVNGSGVITSVNVLSGGNYGSNTPPTLTVTDSATTATGTVSLMPYGVQGNVVQTYNGYVFILNGALELNSAPGSVSDFATSAGGGSRTSVSSTLKVGYTNAISTNGFLFLIGDSSMDYISGIQTNTPSGGSPTTTFTQQNSDPEVGTPYPASVTTLGVEILLANSTGVFVSSGGAFVKISEPLDGVYNTVPASNFNANPFNGFQLSAAKATIFGKRLWMVLVPIIDPVSNSQVNKLLLVRDKKIWSAAVQDVGLTFIQGQEINSVYTAYGTDGTHIYPLFQQPSTSITKLIQSKLWDEPGGYESVKADSRFWSLWDCNSTSSTNLFVNIDSVLIDGSGNQVTNSQNYTITGPAATGHFCTPPQAIGQQGIMTGVTISTAGADLTLVSAKIAAETVGYRG